MWAFSGWRAVDRVFLLLLAAVGVLILAAVAFAPRYVLPAEDAVILFQFSRNLAHTGAITFVPFGPHAEGATDFAWMIWLSLAIKSHLNPFWTVAIGNVACLIAIPFLLARIARVRLHPVAALAIVGCFGLLPQITSAILGFSTLPFAVLLLCLALCFLEERDAALAVVSLFLCLFRPDGVVFAVPMLIAALLLTPGRGRRTLLYTGLFVLPGIAYFLWRWNYFGHFLPLPFLVKSDAQRWAHLIVVSSLMDGLGLVLFAAGLTALVLWKSAAQHVRTNVLAINLLLLPTCFYFAMRLDQNVGLRFFVYLPVGVAALLAARWRSIVPRHSLILRAGAVLWLLLIFKPWKLYVSEVVFGSLDNRFAIANALSGLPHGTLLATEAGTLPYYSGWKTYDPWGLNTAEFATRLFQPGDVKALHPDALLVFQGGQPECKPTQAFATPYGTRTWEHMTRNIVAGAASDDYEVWYLPFGNLRSRRRAHLQTWQDRQECWFIHRSSPLREQIEHVLAEHHGLPEAAYREKQPQTP